ncbi:hypothetical protein AVEN_56166-1 [Araneus ventricosus]|uniref:Uncharacterized protein n=1 Tax=Araneus ventricosus TaxID=182803 RepID=A0A4Y2P5G5_ARAVE|nr:hypothetical protein AVEN_56166-1 [Araneus ventricosus]
MRVPDVIPPPSAKEICSSGGHSAGCATQSVSPFSTPPGTRVVKVSGREMLRLRMAATLVSCWSWRGGIPRMTWSAEVAVVLYAPSKPFTAS